MSTPPKDIRDLINRWKPLGEFASAIGCGYEAARQMRIRNRISPDHWPAVVDAASAKGISGVTFEWLAEQRATARETAA